MTKRLTLLAAALTLTALTFPATASSPRVVDDETTTEAKPALQEVDSIKVCMVNDQLFAKDQIPVEVEGKTYFGCCEMCKARLAEDEAIRHAVDPNTGATVDKATAVKAADASGAIFYFESSESFATYLSEATASPSDD